MSYFAATKEGVIKLLHIRNNLQLADMFTKPLGFTAFHSILDKMKLVLSILRGSVKDEE